MKRIIIFAVCMIGIIAQAQVTPTFKADYNAATYQAYDSTTFYLQPTGGAKCVIVEYPTLNANDAVLFVGACLGDGKGHGNLTWLGTSVPDSVVLNVTTNTVKTRNSAGTRVSTCRTYIWFPDGIPTPMLAFTIKWKSVTTGHIKFYL
jgi:hypothetical protein